MTGPEDETTTMFNETDDNTIQLPPETGTATEEAAPEASAETAEPTKTKGGSKKSKKSKKEKTTMPKTETTPEIDAAEAASYTPVLKFGDLTKKAQEALTTAAALWADAKKSARKGEPVHVDPRALVIVGLDVPDDAGDPLSDPDRATLPLNENWINAIQALGYRGSVVAVVERVLEGCGELPFVMNGRQSTKHVREANARLVKAGEHPCLIDVSIQGGMADDDQAVMVSALNDYRVEDGPSAKARRAVRLLARLKDPAAVATAMNCTPQQVNSYKRFVEAPDAFHKAVDGEKITMTAILPLLRIEGKTAQVEALREVLEEADGRVPSVRDVQGYVKRALGEVEEGDDEDGEGGGSSGPKTPLSWEAGTPPKKRFVKKALGIFLEKHDPEDPKNGEVGEVLIRFANFLLDGSPPPKVFSGAVRAAQPKE